MSGRVVEVVGHGGAGDFFPGNSRPSIEQALKIGVDRVEFDVQRAGDGQLVLVHDERLRHGPGAGLAVRATSTATLRQVLPDLLTFDEAVELIGDRARLTIDAKAPGYEAHLVRAIERHGLIARDALVSSTQAQSLWLMKRRLPELRIGLSTGLVTTRVPVQSVRWAARQVLQVVVPHPLALAARAIGARDVMVKFRLLTPYLLRHLHAHGIRVNAWTVNRPDQIRWAIELGVDSVTSNRPDHVRALVRDLGVASPIMAAD